MSFFYLLLPLCAVFFLIVFRVRRKRIAIPLLLLLVTLLLLIEPLMVGFLVFSEMVNSGEGDPQLMAGMISESLVSAMLVWPIYFAITFAIYLFWRNRTLAKQG